MCKIWQVKNLIRSNVEPAATATVPGRLLLKPGTALMRSDTAQLEGEGGRRRFLRTMTMKDLFDF